MRGKSRHRPPIALVPLSIGLLFGIGAHLCAADSKVQDAAIEAVTEVLEQRVNANLFYLLERSLAHNTLLQQYAPGLYAAARSEELLWLLAQPDLLEQVVRNDVRHIFTATTTIVMDAVVEELTKPGGIGGETTVEGLPRIVERVQSLDDSSFSDSMSSFVRTVRHLQPDDEVFRRFLAALWLLGIPPRSERLSNPVLECDTSTDAQITTEPITVLLDGFCDKANRLLAEGYGGDEVPQNIEDELTTMYDRILGASGEITNDDASLERAINALLSNIGSALGEIVEKDLSHAWPIVFGPIKAGAEAAYDELSDGGGGLLALFGSDAEDSVAAFVGVLDSLEPLFENTASRLSAVADYYTLIQAVTTGDAVATDQIVELAYAAVSVVELVEYIGSRRPRSRSKDQRHHRALDQISTIVLAAAQIVELAEEENHEALVATIDEILLPPVSFATKREGGWHAFVSAYAGIAVGPHIDEIYDSSEWVPFPLLPLGLEITYAGRWAERLSEKNRRRNLSTPISIFVSPVDFAGPLSARLRQEEEDWRFEDILAPSAGFLVGLPELPLALGVFWQGRFDAESIEQTVVMTAALELPLFQLF